MPVSPSDIQALGLEIGQTFQTEVAQRTGVSRIYYSVFLEVRDKLGIRDRRRAHDAVKSALQRRTRKLIADQLSDLRELREMADYDLQLDDWDRKFVRSERLAEQILLEFRKRVS